RRFRRDRLALEVANRAAHGDQTADPRGEARPSGYRRQVRQLDVGVRVDQARQEHAVVLGDARARQVARRREAAHLPGLVERDHGLAKGRPGDGDPPRGEGVGERHQARRYAWSRRAGWNPAARTWRSIARSSMTKPVPADETTFSSNMVEPKSSAPKCSAA